MRSLSCARSRVLSQLGVAIRALAAAFCALFVPFVLCEGPRVIFIINKCNQKSG